MKTSCPLLALLLGSPAIFAQPASEPVIAAPAHSESKTTQLSPADARAALQNTAIEAAARGDFEGAEKLLFTLIKHSPGTAAWHVEASSRLASLAGLIRQDARNPGLVRQLGQRALAQLAQARTLAALGDRALALQIQLRIGAINEDLGGSRAQARAAYQEASRLDPASKEAAAGIGRTTARRAQPAEGSK